MRIGLIAMSGIRACDPELLRLGLTLPGFVERSRTIAALPSLGLLTLAGLTPRRHELRYIEVADLRMAGDLPADFDLVAISSFSAQVREAYELAGRYARLGVPVVIGGLHVTALPQEALLQGASSAAGEGELLWQEILEDAQRGRLRPVYDARGREFDLADAPLPAFEMLDVGRYNRLTVQTSRGCPWRCAFCASSILLTRRYKQKPIDKVLREIDAIRELWPRPFIEFADDNAFVNRAYWRALLPELRRRRLRFFVETDVSIAEDDSLLELARRAGCVEVLLGLESPTGAGLAGLEMRRDWKRRKWPMYRDAVRRIQSHGIRVNACFVLGLDGQDPEVFGALRDFVEDVSPFDVQITYQTPFPGTPLQERLRREGRLTHDGQWERLTLFDITYRPEPMSRQQLRAGFMDLARGLYGRDATRRRRAGFQAQWRRGRAERGGTGASGLLARRA
jgi:radical SAM superfamily enzyme YgiQ (UPF0313 family)